MSRAAPYRVYGMMQSFFTRKMTGYLDYKGVAWRLRRGAGLRAELRSAGWPGGFPALETPSGEVMWDSTAMIHYLERQHPEPAVLPPDPLQRFLAYLIEDVADEWLYRPAVGSRWSYEENARVGGFELARDMSLELPRPCQEIMEIAGAHVRSSCPPLGVTPQNVGCWMQEVLRPWQRALGRHLASRPFLFGDRPSLADLALFGANAAHFTNDPLCRAWTEEEGPQVVQHTHRLLEPENQRFGDWSRAEDPAQVPESLVALLADAGRLYLPWVSRAARHGAAELVFASGERIRIAATPFLREARAVLLARYVALRCDALDAVLERAGILSAFGDFVGDAGTVPDWTQPPRPSQNRPYPPAEAQHAAAQPS